MDFEGEPSYVDETEYTTGDYEEAHESNYVDENEYSYISEEEAEILRNEITCEEIECIYSMQEYNEDELMMDLPEDVSATADMARGEELTMKKPRKSKKGTKEYRRYTNTQIADFINNRQQGMSIKDAANAAGIIGSVAYGYDKQFKATNKMIVRKKQGPHKSNKLNDTHIQFIKKQIDSLKGCPTLTLAELRLNTQAHFTGLHVSASYFYNFIKNECCLSFKKVEKLVKKKTEEEILMARETAVESWKANTDMDFLQNCIFIDESGFNYFMCKSKGWSIKGSPCKAIVPDKKGNNLSIIGAICSRGVLDICVKKMGVVSVTKKRDSDGRTVTIRGKQGTRTDHFMLFINHVMDSWKNSK